MSDFWGLIDLASLAVAFVVIGLLSIFWSRRYGFFGGVGAVLAVVGLVLVAGYDSAREWFYNIVLLAGVLIGVFIAIVVCRVREGFWFPTKKAMEKAHSERVMQRDDPNMSGR